MDIELNDLITRVQEYIDSPHFLLLTEDQKHNFIKFGIPMIIGALIGIKILDGITKTLEIDNKTKQLETLNLELMWKGKNGK